MEASKRGRGKGNCPAVLSRARAWCQAGVFSSSDGRKVTLCANVQLKRDTLNVPSPASGYWFGAETPPAQSRILVLGLR